MTNADMNLLLNDRLAPITSSMGFIEGECSFVAGKFVTWQEELKKTNPFILKISVKTIMGHLEQVLRHLLPLKMGEQNRNILIPTNGNWTAFFDNGYRGTDPSAISYLAKLSGGRSVWIVAEPHIPRPNGEPRQGRPGALIINVYGPEKTDLLNQPRTIRLENDLGKWEFSQSGEPFPFEEPERYNARKVRERFDFDTLKRYLKELGLFPFEENFYLPPFNQKAVLVEQTTKDVRSKDLSLDEARQLNGIEN